MHTDDLTLAASSGKRNVTVWHPSILSRRHTQRDSPEGSICDAASVHFGPTIRRIDIYFSSSYGISALFKSFVFILTVYDEG